MDERVVLVVSTDEWEPSVRKMNTFHYENGKRAGETREEVHARGDGIVFIDADEFKKYEAAKYLVWLFEEETRNQAILELEASEEFGDFDDGERTDESFNPSDFLSPEEQHPRRY